MAIIHFDQAQRREYKEPQTTKKELLKPPTHTAYGDDWNTPRSASSIADRVADTASWSFDNLRSPEGRSASFDAPTKVEAASPMPGVDHQRRPFGLDDTQAHAEQEKRDSPLAAGRGVSGSSPDDKYGRKSGVIDLTADDSEDEQDMAVPERQFVPRAEDDSDVARLQRPKPPSPPRTFTRGLARGRLPLCTARNLQSNHISSDRSISSPRLLRQIRVTQSSTSRIVRLQLHARPTRSIWQEHDFQAPPYVHSKVLLLATQLTP
jgi:hypothetical protein